MTSTPPNMEPAIMETDEISEINIEATKKPDPVSKKSDRVADDGTLTVYSKRSERQRRKQKLKRGKPLDSNIRLIDLPYDILLHIFSLLRPSDVFRLGRTCHPLHDFLLVEHPARVARSIIRWRYPCLEKCLRLPALMADIEEEGGYREALQDQGRLKGHDITRRPYYQHIKPPDPEFVCTCLTCVLRWNVLCLAVDFAHWQDLLDGNEPLPIIPRGRQPEWNNKLLDSHAAVVEKALLSTTSSPSTSSSSSSSSSSLLWYAVILEAHLDSTVRAVRRHHANKYNKRPRFLMTRADADSGTDAFLEGKGPPSVDFPFHRDNYYLLEAYLPNRSWFSEGARWGYMPAEQHDKDLEQVRKWVSWRRKLAQGGGDDDSHDGGTREDKTWTMQFTGSDWRPVLVLPGSGNQTAKAKASSG